MQHADRLVGAGVARLKQGRRRIISLANRGGSSPLYVAIPGIDDLRAAGASDEWRWLSADTEHDPIRP